MPTGFGVSNDANGTGTTPDDIQTITAAEYANPGILAGCEVTGTSAMSYSVKAGAVVISISAGRYVKAPVAPQTIPTEAAPATGSRTDVVYVKQNFPATDGNNAVVVGVGRTAPANSIEIARYTVNAGITATTQAVRIGNTKYARPIGSTLGSLGGTVDTDGTVHAGELLTRGSVSFYVPTDRSVEFSFQSCVSTDLAATNNGPRIPGGSVMYKIYVDGVLQRSFERGYSTLWDVQHFEFGMLLNVGAHTAHYTVERRWFEQGATGKWRVRHGGAEKFPGDIFSVTDRGVAVV